MRLSHIFLLVVFCFGCCKALPYGNLRLRLSAKVLDVFISTITNKTNKRKPFEQFFFDPTRFGGQISDITFKLDPDTNTAEMSFQLNSVYICYNQLHRIDNVKFEFGIQLQQLTTAPKGHFNLIMTKCNFTTTTNTNLLDFAVLIDSAAASMCEALRHQLDLYQTVHLTTVIGVVLARCRPVEPSGIFHDRIDLIFNCNATLGEHYYWGERRFMEQGSPLPPMPVFEADQPTLEIQSSDSFHQIALLPTLPESLIMRKSVDYRVGPKLFTEIVPLLDYLANSSGLDNTTGLDPRLLLLGTYNFTINYTHVTMDLAIKEGIITNEQLIILQCLASWKTTIQMSDGPQRSFKLSKMQNVDGTLNDTNIRERVLETTQDNTVLADQTCRQLHTTLERNQIFSEIIFNKFLAYFAYYIQDSAMLLKIDLAKFIQSIFDANTERDTGY